MHLIFKDQQNKKEKIYSEPINDDQERKKEKFKSYLFSEAKNITTPELLSQIVNIIQGTYFDELKIRNETENDNQIDVISSNDDKINMLESNENKNSVNSNKNDKDPEFIIDASGCKKYR